MYTPLMLVMWALWLLGFILAIVFVVSHKRIALAQEEMANAHKEIAKQIAELTSQLKYKNE